MSTTMTTDLPELTQKPEAAPAATAHHSVLIQPGGAIPIAGPPLPPAVYTLAGSTANFKVAFDSTLASVGQTLAFCRLSVRALTSTA